MTREELTTLLHQYAVEYSDFKLEELSGIVSKPPVNPVNTILSEVETLKQQVAYWKLSFHKQIEAASSADSRLLDKLLARRAFKKD